MEEIHEIFQVVVEEGVPPLAPITNSRLQYLLSSDLFGSGPRLSIRQYICRVGNTWCPGAMVATPSQPVKPLRTVQAMVFHNLVILYTAQAMVCYNLVNWSYCILLTQAMVCYNLVTRGGFVYTWKIGMSAVSLDTPEKEREFGGLLTRYTALSLKI